MAVERRQASIEQALFKDLSLDVEFSLTKTTYNIIQQPLEKSVQTDRNNPGRYVPLAAAPSPRSAGAGFSRW